MDLASVVSSSSVLVVIYLICVVANVLLFWMTVKTNIFSENCQAKLLVRNAIIVDVLCSVDCLTSAIGYIDPKIIASNAVICEAEGLRRWFAKYLAAFSYLLLAVNRFIIMTKPHVARAVYTRKKTLIYIAIVWICAAAIAITIAFGEDRATFTPLFDSCWKPPTILGRRTAVFILLATISITVCFYARAGWAYRSRQRRMQRRRSSRQICAASAKDNAQHCQETSQTSQVSPKSTTDTVVTDAIILSSIAYSSNAEKIISESHQPMRSPKPSSNEQPVSKKICCPLLRCFPTDVMSIFNNLTRSTKISNKNIIVPSQHQPDPILKTFAAITAYYFVTHMLLYGLVLVQGYHKLPRALLMASSIIHTMRYSVNALFFFVFNNKLRKRAWQIIVLRRSSNTYL